VRRCPRLLFQEEQEQLEEDERLQVLQHQQPDTQSLGDDANESPVNHSDHAATGVSANESAADEDAVVTRDVTVNETATPSNKSRISTSSSNSGSSVKKASSKLSSQYLHFAICPEIGISKQSFKCADCEEVISFGTSRICDYDGLYYCFSCHWNDWERTPARILHNWDFSVRPVSRRSLQIITFIKRQPVLFDVLDFNPMLYGLVEDLPFIKVHARTGSPLFVACLHPFTAAIVFKLSRNNSSLLLR
jgi:hypothetical protein